MKLLSPAKVNLHLKVLKKRQDGYHEIRTVLQQIDLFDEIEILPGGPGIRLVAEGEETPGGMENLVCRAAQVLLQEAGRTGGFQIRLVKRIPVAAGLGGGSGNAAAVLRGLNEELKTGLEARQLMDLGARIGADVPFFLFGKAALARGIGEQLTAVRLPEGLWFLLLVPPFRISTAWAYQAFDRLASAGGESAPIRDTYPELESLLPILQNDLERVVEIRFPQIRQMKEELLARGASGALMSGSGPVVFGLFPTREEAMGTEEKIDLPEGWKTIIARAS